MKIFTAFLLTSTVAFSQVSPTLWEEYDQDANGVLDPEERRIYILHVKSPLYKAADSDPRDGILSDKEKAAYIAAEEQKAKEALADAEEGIERLRQRKEFLLGGKWGWSCGTRIQPSDDALRDAWPYRVQNRKLKTCC